MSTPKKADTELDELKAKVTSIINEAIEMRSDRVLCDEASDYAGNVPYAETDQILALIATEKTKLLQSLLEKMPKKKQTLNYLLPHDIGRNEALSEVTSVIEDAIKSVKGKSV